MNASFYDPRPSKFKGYQYDKFEPGSGYEYPRVEKGKPLSTSDKERMIIASQYRTVDTTKGYLSGFFTHQQAIENIDNNFTFDGKFWYIFGDGTPINRKKVKLLKQKLKFIVGSGKVTDHSEIAMLKAHVTQLEALYHLNKVNSGLLSSTRQFNRLERGLTDKAKASIESLRRSYHKYCFQTANRFTGLTPAESLKQKYALEYTGAGFGQNATYNTIITAKESKKVANIKEKWGSELERERFQKAKSEIMDNTLTNVFHTNGLLLNESWKEYAPDGLLLDDTYARKAYSGNITGLGFRGPKKITKNKSNINALKQASLAKKQQMTLLENAQNAAKYILSEKEANARIQSAEGVEKEALMKNLGYLRRAGRNKMRRQQVIPGQEREVEREEEAMAEEMAEAMK